MPQEIKWIKDDKLQCHHYNSGCRIFPSYGDPLSKSKKPDSCFKHKGINRDKHYCWKDLSAFMAPCKINAENIQKAKGKITQPLFFDIQQEIDISSAADFSNILALNDTNVGSDSFV